MKFLTHTLLVGVLLTTGVPSTLHAQGLPPGFGNIGLPTELPGGINLPSVPNIPSGIPGVPQVGTGNQVTCPDPGALTNVLKSFSSRLGVLSGSAVPVNDRIVRRNTEKTFGEVKTLRYKECVLDPKAAEIRAKKIAETVKETLDEINTGRDGNAFYIERPLAFIEEERVNPAVKEVIDTVEKSTIPSRFKGDIVRTLTEEHFTEFEKALEPPQNTEYLTCLETGVCTKRGFRDAVFYNPLSLQAGIEEEITRASELAETIALQETDRGFVARRDENCDEENPLNCDIVTPALGLSGAYDQAAIRSPADIARTFKETGEEALPNVIEDTTRQTITRQGGAKGLNEKAPGQQFSFLDLLLRGALGIIANLPGGGLEDIANNTQGSIRTIIAAKESSEVGYKTVKEDSLILVTDAETNLNELLACYEEKGPSGQDGAERVVQTISQEITPRITALETDIRLANTTFEALNDLEQRTQQVQNASTSQILNNLLLEAQTFNVHDASNVFLAEQEQGEIQSVMSALHEETAAELAICKGTSGI